MSLTYFLFFYFRYVMDSKKTKGRKMFTKSYDSVLSRLLETKLITMPAYLSVIQHLHMFYLAQIQFFHQVNIFFVMKFCCQYTNKMVVNFLPSCFFFSSKIITCIFFGSYGFLIKPLILLHIGYKSEYSLAYKNHVFFKFQGN